MIFQIQINAHSQINQIKTNWFKKMFFNFQFAQLTNIWIDCRQLQSHQQVQIAKSSTSSDCCSDLLPLIHIEQDRRIRNGSVHIMMDIIFSCIPPVLLGIFWDNTFI